MASTIGNCQQCRDDLAPGAHQVKSRINSKDPNAYNNQMMASTVCCTKTNCDKMKLELMPEHFYSFEPAQSSAFQHSDGKPDVIQEPLSKKMKTVETPHEPPLPFCNCTMATGQLVIYCCMRKDCDESTKIAEAPPDSRAYTNFKF